MNIRTLTPGEKVTEAGVYDIPLEQYHGDIAAAPSISSSGLRLIEQKSPAHYYATSYLNPDHEPEERTPALNIGAAVHCLLLTPELFSKEVSVHPFKDFARNEEIGGVKWTKTEKIKWRDAEYEAGRAVIGAEQLDALCQMRDVLMREPLIEGGIFQGQIEKSIIWPDDETGVFLKSRLDVIPDDDVLVDYKTIANGHPDHIEREIYKHGYEMQLALGAEAMWQVLGKRTRMVCLIFQEKEPPYAVTPVELDLIDLYDGFNLNRRAVRLFAECVKTGQWPGYDCGAKTGGIFMPSRPKYDANRIEARRKLSEEDPLRVPEIEPPFFETDAKDQAA